MSFSLRFGELNTQQTVAVHFPFLFASLDSYCISLCAFLLPFPFYFSFICLFVCLLVGWLVGWLVCLFVCFCFCCCCLVVTFSETEFVVASLPITLLIKLSISPH